MRTPIRRLAPAGAIAFAAASAFGQVNVFEYRVSTELNQTYDERAEFEYVGPINASVVTPPIGQSIARADVGTGINKTVAIVQGPNPATPIETAVSDAFAEWGDIVTISDPKLNGQPGTFEARLRVNGAGTFSMSPELANDADVFLLAHWAAVTNVYAIDNGTIEPQEFGFAGEWFQGFGEPLEYGGDPLNSYQEDFTVNFIYGEPFVLSTFLQTIILFDNINLTQGTIDAEMDLGNSAYWAGISAIRNAQGQVNPDAALSSQSGVRWDYEVDPNSARADFDDNGLVNLGDFNILAANFGTSVTPWQLGDATGDGLVNLADFNKLAANFGLQFDSEPTPEDWSTLAAAIPEPATGVMVALGALALLQCRRRT